MNKPANDSTLLRGVLQTGVKLAVLTGMVIMVVAWIDLATRDQILTAKKQASEKVLKEVAGQSEIQLTASANDVYVTKDKDGHTGFIVPAVTQQGYNGEIKLWVGIDYRGRITGVRVIKHRETPGLGDKMLTSVSDWITGFNGKSLQNPAEDGWQVKKDGGEFDQFTGATITPRAIVRAVHHALLNLNPEDLNQENL